MKLFYILIIFLSVHLVDLHVYASTDNANLTEKDLILKDCKELNDYLCHYKEAKRIFDKFWYAENINNETYEKVSHKVSEYLLIFIKNVENKNYTPEANLQKDALLNYIRTKWVKPDLTFNELNEIFEYNEKLISLGEVYNSWRYCVYSQEFYQSDVYILSDSDITYLKNTLHEHCAKFISEDSLFPTYDTDHLLADTWDLESKEQILFDVHLTLYFSNLNNDLTFNTDGNAVKSIEHALEAEKIYLNRKYDWNPHYENRLSTVYRSLGSSYSYGFGTLKDPIKGIEYLEKASALDSTIANYRLGEIYLSGEFNLLDFSKAREYFLKNIDLDSSDYASLHELGEIYLFGFGTERNLELAEKYFSLAQKALVEIEKDPKRSDIWPPEVSERYLNRVNKYLGGFQNGSYIARASYMCNIAYTAYNQGFPISHLIRACKYNAENNNLYEKVMLIEFNRIGIGMPKDPYRAYNMSKDLIQEIKNDSYKETKFTDWLDDKEHYKEKIKDNVIFLNGQNALSIFNGAFENTIASEAYEILEEYLFEDSNPSHLNDAWYIQDWYMYIMMKIDGWGTQKDLRGAEELVNLLLINYEQEKIDSEFGNDFHVGIDMLNLAKDKLIQSKSGYSLRSKTISKFPAVYSGEMIWDQSTEVLGNRNIPVIFKINNVKRTGFKNYTLTGSIEFITAQETETFLISGLLDDETKLITFEEYDDGTSTFYNEDYAAGKYYGSINDNFNNIELQFVSKNGNDFAYVQLFKEVDATLLVDYKSRLGIKDQYAVVIGNNEYEHLAQLETATADARSIADVLNKKYGFEVEEPLINASRDEILMKLSHMAKILGEDDSLLIFYAGHGRQDEETGRGYWSPIDAYEDNYINDISNDDIANILKKINSRHILVIADSCYSGSLVLRGATISNNRDISYLKTLISKNSRKALTSGALQPVSDTGENGHSAFANSLLSILTENSNPITANELHQEIRPTIMSNYNQTPLYNVVGNSGDEGGEFLFVPVQ